MKWLFIRLAIIMSLLTPILRVLADERTPITPENLDRLTELASTGRGTIYGLFWTPNGENLIAVDDAGFYFYDGDDLTKLPRFIEDKSGEIRHHDNFVLSPDGTFIIDFYTSLPEFHVWNLDDQGQLTRVKLPINDALQTEQTYGYGVSQVAFSPDNSTIVVATYNGSLFLWDVSHDDEAIAIADDVDNQSLGSVLQVAFSPDGNWFVSCFSDGHLQIWNTATWELVGTLYTSTAQSGYGDVSFEFNSDGSQLLTRFSAREVDYSTGTASISLWSFPAGELITSQEVSVQSVIGFDQTDTAIAIVSEPTGETWQRLIQLVEIESGVKRWQVEGSYLDMGFFASSHQRFVLFSYSGDGYDIQVLSLEDGHEIMREYATLARPNSLSPDGTRLAVAGNTFGDIQGWRHRETVLRIWDLNTGDLLTSNYDHATDILNFVFSPNARYLAFSHDEASIRVLDTITWETHSFNSWLDIYQGMPRRSATNLRFNSDSTQLTANVSSSNGSEITALWNVKTGEFVNDPPIDTIFTTSPDERFLATLNTKYRYGNSSTLITSIITVRDIVTQTDLFSLEVGQAIQQLVYSPDGTLLTGAGEQSNLLIWDAKTGDQLASLKSTLDLDYYLPSQLNISLDNRLLTVKKLYYNEPIEIWDIATKQLWPAWTAKNYPIRELHFSPDGSYFATVGLEDYTLRFWDTATAEELTNMGSLQNVADVTFSPDGRLLAVETFTYADEYYGPRPEQIWFWDIEKGELLAQLPGHAVLYDPLFSPDGTLLAVRSTGRRVIVYGVE